MITLLVTDITSYKAAVVVRHLRERWPGVRLIVTDHRSYARHIHTRHAKDVIILNCKPDDGEIYAQALGDVIVRERVDYLIPVNSKEIRILVAHRDRLGRALDYMGSSTLYQQLDDKAAFASLLEEVGLPSPRHHSSLNARLPLVIKPARGSSAKGVSYLNTEAQRAALISQIGVSPAEYVIQDYIEGEGVGFSGFFREGRAIVSYAHRRVGEYPVSGGSSVVREHYPYDDLAELTALVHRLLDAAPWSGFAMFELKRRGPGDFSFIECNPRVWGSIHQGLADGSDYFAPLLQPVQTGEPFPPLPDNIRTVLLPLNFLAAAGYWRLGKKDKSADIVRGFWHQKADIHPLDDPLGFLSLLLRGA